MLSNPQGASRFEFKRRLGFTIEKRGLENLITELKEDQLSLAVIIEKLETVREFTPRQPSGDAEEFATILSKVQQQAAPLYEAVRKGCNCDCKKKHKVFMRLDGRIPLPKSGQEIPKEKTEFNLIFDHQGYLQETHVLFDEEYDFRNINTSKHVLVQQVTQLSRGKMVTEICHHVSALQKTGHILKLQLKKANLLLIEGQLENRRDFESPKTLADILQAGIQDEDLKILPREQTLLALNVASSILQLQQTWWLGPPFNSNEIKILSPTEELFVESSNALFIESHLRNISSPLQTKGRSTPVGPDPKTALTDLAILLLEIWHLKPLAVRCEGLEKQNPITIEERMLEASSWLQATSKRLLPFQSEVVEFCLQVCIGSLRAWDNRDFLRKYCENIIKPLQTALGG
jgi:hypothetical protein